MNFLTGSSRVRGFAFAVVIWAASLLASDLEQNNQPVRSPDTPVLSAILGRPNQLHQVNVCRNYASQIWKRQNRCPGI